MSGLAILWAVHGATGSFARAGLATGAFAATEALIGPQVARSVDAHGQRRVLVVTVPAFASIAAGLGVCTLDDRVPLGLLVVLAGLAGALCPQVGTLSTARWRHVTGDTEHRVAALSLEAAVNDVSFLIGPVVVTTLSATLHPTLGLATSTVLIVVGVGLLLRDVHTEPPAQPRGPGVFLDSRLLTPDFVPFPAVHLCLGTFFGAVPVCLTSFALSQGAGATAGAFSAASGVVSLVAGLTYGGLAGRVRPLPVMIIASVVLAGGCVLLGSVSSVGVMLIVYALVGGMVAPILIPAAVLLQRAVPSGVYTQAVTWTGSASAVGVALAAPVVGHVVEQTTPSTGFALTGCLMTTLPVLVVLLRHRLTASSV